MDRVAGSDPALFNGVGGGGSVKILKIVDLIKLPYLFSLCIRRTDRPEQTVYTQIGLRILWRLIRVYTVCHHPAIRKRSQTVK